LLRLIRVVAVLGNGLRRARAILTHHGLHFVLLAAVLIVFVGAGAELIFESKAKGSNIHNYANALWWAITTITTVGYGDRYPVSAGGRGVAVVLMLVGIGLIGVITASVASYFVAQESETNVAEAVVQLDARLDRIEALLAASLPPAAPSTPSTLASGSELSLGDETAISSFGQHVKAASPPRSGRSELASCRLVRVVLLSLAVDAG
jgi:voltage-gated potassium channel